MKTKNFILHDGNTARRLSNMPLRLYMQRELNLSKAYIYTNVEHSLEPFLDVYQGELWLMQ